MSRLFWLDLLASVPLIPLRSRSGSVPSPCWSPAPARCGQSWLRLAFQRWMPWRRLLSSRLSCCSASAYWPEPAVDGFDPRKIPPDDGSDVTARDLLVVTCHVKRVLAMSADPSSGDSRL